MIVIDFESLPEAVVAVIVTMFAPTINPGDKVNCFVTRLYANALVGIPFKETEICEADATFKTVAVIAATGLLVLNGLTFGTVIDTIGAGEITG